MAMLGASRAVSEKTSNKYTTGIGTPLYMAPEILRREPYDLSSDIYRYLYLWSFSTLFTNVCVSFPMSCHKIDDTFFF